MTRSFRRVGGLLATLSILLLVAGCVRGGAMSAEELAVARNYVGVWQDQETESLTTVAIKGERLQVVSVVGSDGENYPVKEQQWKDGLLSWSYFVPSTEYLVKIEATGVEGNALNFHWSNHESSGDDAFLKQE